MCVVSAMGDHWGQKWDPEEWKKQYPLIPHPLIPQDTTRDWQKEMDKLQDILNPKATKQEVDELKHQLEELRKEVLQMKEILKIAKEYDERNNEPHCEMESKVKLLKEVAKMMGVDLSEIFPEQTTVKVGDNPTVTNFPIVTSGYVWIDPSTITTITTGGSGVTYNATGSYNTTVVS